MRLVFAGDALPDAWQYVERFTGVHGEAPWYLGLRAYGRTEQGLWYDAADLADANHDAVSARVDDVRGVLQRARERCAARKLQRHASGLRRCTGCRWSCALAGHQGEETHQVAAAASSLAQSLCSAA